MPKIKASIDIQAPREQVFQVFSDLPACAERIQGIDKIEMLSDGPMQVGTRWRETRTMFGKEATEEMWVTQFDVPAGYTVEAESHGTNYISRYDFEDLGDVTRVAMSFTGQPLSLSAKLMSVLGVVFMGSVKKMLLADMQDLKTVCEQ